MISIKSKLLLASTALVAVAGQAQALDVSNAVTTADNAELVYTDVDESTTVNTGDTITTSAAGATVEAALAANATLTTAIDSDVDGVTLTIDSAISRGNGASGTADSVVISGANTTTNINAAVANTATGAEADAVSITGAGNTVNVGAALTEASADGAGIRVGDVASTINVLAAGNTGIIDASAADTATSVTTLTIAGTAAAVTTGDAADAITVSGTAVAVATGAGNDTVTVSGTVASLDVVSGDNTVNVTNGTVTGALDGGAGVDTLNISGNAASTTGAIDLDAGADVITISSTNTGSTKSTLASVDGGDDADTLTHSSGYTDVTGAVDNVETINVTGGTLTVGGNLGATDLDDVTVASGATLNVTGTTGIDNDLVVAGTVATTAAAAVGNDLTVSGEYTAANNTTVAGNAVITGETNLTGTSSVTGTTNVAKGAYLNITGGTTTLTGVATLNGKAVVSNGATLDTDASLTDTSLANVTLELADGNGAHGSLVAAQDLNGKTVGLTVAQGVDVADLVGDTHNAIITGNAATTGADDIKTGNALLNYTWSANASNGYDLAVTLKKAGVTTLEGAVATNKGLAAELERTTGTPRAANTADLYKEVFKQSDTEGALETLTSDVSGGLVGASFDAAKGVAKSVETRLASLRGQSGIAAGDMQANGAMWVKAFGSTANQDARDGSSGYDADTLGFAYGVDSDNIVKGATVGLALSYAGSEVDAEAGSETDVSSYQLTAYASKDLGNRAYVDAQVGIAYNEFETDRTDFLGDKYSADFDGMQYSAAVEAGRSMDYMGATVTPKLGLQYITQSMDSYSETGTGANGLSVDNDDVSALYARVGADVAWNFATANGMHMKPYVSAAISHDLIADNMEARTSFTAGGNAFKVEGADVEETAFEIGTGIEIMSVSGVDLTVAYDGVFKEDYDSHAGSIKARWAF